MTTGAAVPATWVKVAKLTITAAASGTIAATGTHKFFKLVGRIHAVSGAAGAYITFNGDAAAHYSWGGSSGSLWAYNTGQNGIFFGSTDNSNDSPIELNFPGNLPEGGNTPGMTINSGLWTSNDFKNAFWGRWVTSPATISSLTIGINAGTMSGEFELYYNAELES